MIRAASPAVSGATSSVALQSSESAERDLAGARVIATLSQVGSFHYELRAGARDVWIVVAAGGDERIALRAGVASELAGEPALSRHGEGFVVEFQTAAGGVRVKVAFPASDEATVRWTTSLLPVRDTALTAVARDVFVLGDPEGTIVTAQRGLRSGIVFAASTQPSPLTLFYFQDFSALNALYEACNQTPADSVGGVWPQLGFQGPRGDACVLRSGVEYTISDAYLSLALSAPATNAEAAAAYLDRLAAVYTLLPLPGVTYREWPERAARTLRDLSLSPRCTYVRGGQRYLMPYVGDETKPPESMVQLTALLNALEYDTWRGEQSGFTRMLRAAVPNFYDAAVGSVVRWLPGADFGAQSEENMNHEDMDSWYLYHALFNLSRLAALGDAGARALFEKSLPFAVRVARRFSYEFPIFFHLRTLDIVRAESEPGKGGERDVPGLYALVMLHAHELFGGAEYLEEARRAVARLEDAGFNLAYQVNTTGFAAEAALRLWKITGEKRYLGLAELCMANLFDNTWLWQCDYGHARAYRLFFGLFPLHDAPYLAAYEELEAVAKFNEFLALGGADVRPALRLLLAEFCRYTLDRGWYYYPDALPADATAPKARNGAVERALSVPLEDLQDGREQSGQVGQELYGAGLPFVLTSRHYYRHHGSYIYCGYPLLDVTRSPHGEVLSFRIGGDPRGACELRVIPLDPDAGREGVTLTVAAGSVALPVEGRVTVEGHIAFALRGDQRAKLRFGATARAVR